MMRDIEQLNHARVKKWDDGVSQVKGEGVGAGEAPEGEC